MQDLPDHAAEPMSDGPNSGLIAQPRQQTPEHGLKITTVLLPWVTFVTGGTQGYE
jgi:hypothetical protein